MFSWCGCAWNAVPTGASAALLWTFFTFPPTPSPTRYTVPSKRTEERLGRDRRSNRVIFEKICNEGESFSRQRKLKMLVP